MAVEPDNEPEVEEVDVEEYVKQGRRPPKAKKYRIRIDREKYVVNKPVVTGPELLALVGKTPDRWRIHQKLRGGQMDEVQPGEKVDLRAKGVERFVTMELVQTDGEAAATEALPVSAEPEPRRVFRLPEDDEDYLNSLGLQWEAIEDSGGRWVLIHAHPLPDGFNHGAATMAIRIEAGYPPAKLDMVYYFPSLGRSNGRDIPALSTQQLDGVTYQRWSRHYEWREGIDCLATHHWRIKEWLTDELRR